MKPLTYYEQIIKMPNKADKFDLRLQFPFKSAKRLNYRLEIN